MFSIPLDQQEFKQANMPKPLFQYHLELKENEELPKSLRLAFLFSGE
jgi:hypothetical protein